MDTYKHNVILMDCEQRCAEGVLYSLASHGLSVSGLSPRRRCPAYYSKHLSHFYRSPKLSEGFDVYFDFLVNLPLRGVLVPSGDLSVIFLSRYRAGLEEHGFLLNVVDEELLLQVFDKWTCNLLCRQYAVPVAQTELIEQPERLDKVISQFSWPVIVKPTRLAGGNYVRAFDHAAAVAGYEKIRRVVESDEFRSHQSGIILQQWVDSGMEDNWSCEAFFDQNGQFVDAVTIKRVRTSLNSAGTPTSRLYAGVITPNEELRNLTVEFLKSLGWRGLSHVEYIYSRQEGTYLLTEVNPRLPGYSYLLSASGHEHAYYYCADLLGLPYQPTPAPGPTFYFESLRYPGDLTDGAVNSVRGYLSVRSIFRSYATAFRSPGNIVVDYFNRRDLRLTTANLAFNMALFFRKMVAFVRRRLL